MKSLSNFEFLVMQELIKKGHSFSSQFEFECHIDSWKRNKKIEKNKDSKIYAYRIDKYEKNIINIARREIHNRIKTYNRAL